MQRVNLQVVTLKLSVTACGILSYNLNGLALQFTIRPMISYRSAEVICMAPLAAGIHQLSEDRRFSGEVVKSFQIREDFDLTVFRLYSDNV